MNAIGLLVQPIEALSLETTYVWVTANCRYERMARHEKGCVTLCCEHGHVVSVTDKEFTEGFLPIIDCDEFQARYRPAKAQHVPSKSMFALNGGDIITVETGGAVLLTTAGDYMAVEPEVYRTCYEVVGYPGSPFPATPFNL